MRITTLPLGSSFRWKLIPAALVAALGDLIFYQEQTPGGRLGLFALGLLAALLAGRPAVRRSPRAWIAILIAVVFAIALLYDPSLLAWTLFWVAAGMATLLPATARFDDGWRWTQRLLWQGLRAPFTPLIDLAHLARVRKAGRSQPGNLRASISLLALPVIGSAVILVLFAAANPLIERALSAMMPGAWDTFILLGRAMIWSLCFVMAWCLLRPSLAQHLLPAMAQTGERALPGVSVASVTVSLVLFNLIFAAQNLLDAAYLWSVAPMPGGLTMAQYAHRGAYPLIVTALLAALFVLVALRPGADTARSAAIRRLVTLWIGQNIFLVVSSMLRTIDYVEAYSLTRLRIAALAWMALVAFGLAAICWRALRGRSAGWLINVNMGAAGLVLTAGCFVDLGAVAARWNVEHAREVGGKGAALDLCYLDQLGGSALLPLLTLENQRGLQPAFRERVQVVRMQAYDALLRQQGDDGAFLTTWRLGQASRMPRSVRPVPIQDGPRACDGTLLPPPPQVEVAPPPAPIVTPVPAATPSSTLTAGSRK
jgi:hypothetical protein